MRRPKVWHEVRCGVHGFIRFNNLERRLINSAPVQRLKHIHQLAMTFQVYPGATHRRFEHSLGVMHLAGQAFDSLMDPAKAEYGAAYFEEAVDAEQRAYWREIVRLAALLHDVGHLPFSHAAEKALLPAGWSHETLTRELVLSSEIAEILSADRRYHPADVVKLALEPGEQPETVLTPWEGLLNELITGATFGVDRMDYLLRDSLHSGVPYGRFDPLRLLDSLVILQPPQPPAAAGLEGEIPEIPKESAELRRIGVYEGGIHGVEALLVARYFMYTQLYFHDVRRAYDGHLIDFLKVRYTGNSYPTEIAKHLAETDNEVLAHIRQAATDPGHPGHRAALRIQQHNHFRTAFSFKQADLSVEAGGAELLKTAERRLQEEFGAAHVRVDSHFPRKGEDEIFVLADDDRVVSGRAEFPLLRGVPPAWFAYVLCEAELVEKVAASVRRILN